MIGGFPKVERIPGLGSLIIIIAMALPATAWAQEPGEQLFQSNCGACHTVGGGRLVGPDLAGVHENRSQEWLEKFVASPKSMIDSGDVEAVAIFEEYNEILMPDAPYSSEQVKQVLSYVKAKSSNEPDSSVETPVEVASPAEPPSMEDVVKGQDLFQGTTRFVNDGPACNTCHDVKHDAVIGGGILAAELTTVFSRMGVTGVKAILGQAPFPVMQIAYENKELTEEETTYLVAFLQNADKEHLLQQPRDYGMGLFFSGAIGAGIMFLFFGFVWRGRKSGSVNQAIYDRQLKSFSDDAD